MRCLSRADCLLALRIGKNFVICAADLESWQPHYRKAPRRWASCDLGRWGQDSRLSGWLLRDEDDAYGLCWPEIAHGLHLDLRRSFIGQLLLGILGSDTVS